MTPARALAEQNGKPRLHAKPQRDPGFNFWSEDEDADVVTALETLRDPKNTSSPWLLNAWG